MTAGSVAAVATRDLRSKSRDAEQVVCGGDEVPGELAGVEHDGVAVASAGGDLERAAQCDDLSRPVEGDGAEDDDVNVGAREAMHLVAPHFQGPLPPAVPLSLRSHALVTRRVTPVRGEPAAVVARR